MTITWDPMAALRPKTVPSSLEGMNLILICEVHAVYCGDPTQKCFMCAAAERDADHR